MHPERMTMLSRALLVVAAAVQLAHAEEVGSVAVTLAAKNKGECDASFKTYLWMPKSALAPLGAEPGLA